MTTIHYRIPFFLLFVMLALPFISEAQLGDKRKTIDLLCHKWVVSLAKNPQKMDCFPPDADSTIHFLTTGYIIFSEKNGPEGAWNYDAVRNNLYVLINGNLWKYRINSLSANELIAESTTGKNTTVWHLSGNR